jgi:hypothetical protein
LNNVPVQVRVSLFTLDAVDGVGKGKDDILICLLLLRLGLEDVVEGGNVGSGWDGGTQAERTVETEERRQGDI